MSRAKNRGAIAEQNPTDMSFSIPEHLAHLVLHDTGSEDRNRIITLGDEAMLPSLKSDLLFGDGTFDVVPALFYQLYTVSGIIKLV